MTNVKVKKIDNMVADGDRDGSGIEQSRPLQYSGGGIKIFAKSDCHSMMEAKGRWNTSSKL